MADSLLSRWSERKLAARSGRQLDQPELAASVATDAKPGASEPGTDKRPALKPPAPTSGLASADPWAASQPGLASQATGALDAAALAPNSAALADSVAPTPTLEDAQALTPQSDFRRFVAADVSPEVKHVALRKLFADPHFNVMDGLDIYIDDYSQADPLPLAQMRKLASAQFLGLVEEDKPKPARADATSEAAAPAEPTMRADTTYENEDHEDPDLRLQQDHASGSQGPGRRAG